MFRAVQDARDTSVPSRPRRERNDDGDGGEEANRQGDSKRGSLQSCEGMCAVDFDESGCPQDGRRSQESWLSIPRSIPGGPTAGAGTVPGNRMWQPASGSECRDSLWGTMRIRDGSECGVARCVAEKQATVAVYVGGMLVARRAVVPALLTRFRHRGRLTDNLFAAAIALVLLSAWVTGWLGLHWLLGAFFAGVPGGSRLRREKVTSTGQEVRHSSLLLRFSCDCKS